MKHPCLAALLLVLPSFIRAASAQACPDRPNLGTQLRRYTGLYENYAYGYVTQLPDGVTGLDTDSPDYQRGFVILLPQDGGALTLFAETNSTDYRTPAPAAASDLADLRSRAEQLLSTRTTVTQLGSRTAAVLTAEFRCRKDPQRYEHISIFSLGMDRRFLYTLSWEGPLAHVAEANALLKNLQRSWKFVPIR